MILSTFYESLNSNVRLSLDVANERVFKKSHMHQAKALLEQLTSNNYAWKTSGANSVKSSQDIRC